MGGCASKKRRRKKKEQEKDVTSEKNDATSEDSTRYAYVVQDEEVVTSVKNDAASEDSCKLTSYAHVVYKLYKLLVCLMHYCGVNDEEPGLFVPIERTNGLVEGDI